MKKNLKSFLLLLLPLIFLMNISHAAKDDKVLLTVFLKHDQTKNLIEIQKHQNENGFFEKFPPKGAVIIDWVVAMGIGQIVILETSEDKVKDVEKNLAEVTKNAFDYQLYKSTNLAPSILKKLKFGAKKNLSESAVPSGSLILSVILRPNQGLDKKKVSQIVSEQKLYENFPPEGSQVIHWLDVQDVGELVMLSIPADLLRPTNIGLERFGWKAYKTSFYPSYDFFPIARDVLKLKNNSRKTLVK